VLAGERRLELVDVALREPGEGEVAVRVEACGVCATNLHDWAHPERAMRGSELPGAHGHELAGVVTAAGSGVDALAPGDLVCLEPGLACACGACDACRDGRPRSCGRRSALPVWGFADAIVVPARGLVAVPAGLDLDVASLAEPLSSALHGLRRSFTAAATGRLDGVEVAVVGAGAMGLCTVLAARALGAAAVTVVARHTHQARAGAALGADRALEDGSEAERSLRQLRPRLVVEAAGGDGSALGVAARVVGEDGEIVVLGLPSRPVPLEVGRLVLRNARMLLAAGAGIDDGVPDIARALEILAATPAAACLISHRFELADVGAAFATAADRGSSPLRVVVEPRGAVDDSVVDR
jgi:L-idonate 5-dehydrogenase